MRFTLNAKKGKKNTLIESDSWRGLFEIACQIIIGKEKLPFDSIRIFDETTGKMILEYSKA